MTVRNLAAPLRVGNMSGFYGDRISAMREMLEGGELDVLTGDYLAELTMLILGRDRMKNAELGYAKTFLRQLEDCLGLALEKNVRIVANAGGLNPAGLAGAVVELGSRLGLSPRVAHVEGDDLIDRVSELDIPADAGFPVTANAYLGGFGIAPLSGRRCRHRRHRSRHRRLGHRRSGDQPLRVDPDGPRRPRRRHRRGARHRVRDPGHGRQLRLLQPR